MKLIICPLLSLKWRSSLHLLKSDAYRTGISTSSVCDCAYDSETVEHFILQCCKYDSERSQLIATVESLWHDVKDMQLINYTLLLHMEVMTLLQGKKIHLLSLHCLTF